MTLDKQTKQLAITAVLVLVLIATVLGNLKKKPSKKGGASQPSAPVAPVAGVSVSPAEMKPNDELSQQLARLQLSWGRDPFSPGMDKGFQLGDLQLKGISYSKTRGGFAFINDEIVKKGDTIGEYEVENVDKDRVLLRRGNQSFYVMFPEDAGQ